MLRDVFDCNVDFGESILWRALRSAHLHVTELGCMCIIWVLYELCRSHILLLLKSSLFVSFLSFLLLSLFLFFLFLSLALLWSLLNDFILLFPLNVLSFGFSVSFMVFSVFHFCSAQIS